MHSLGLKIGKYNEYAQKNSPTRPQWTSADFQFSQQSYNFDVAFGVPVLCKPWSDNVIIRSSIGNRDYDFVYPLVLPPDSSLAGDMKYICGVKSIGSTVWTIPPAESQAQLYSMIYFSLPNETASYTALKSYVCTPDVLSYESDPQLNSASSNALTPSNAKVVEFGNTTSDFNTKINEKLDWTKFISWDYTQTEDYEVRRGGARDKYYMPSGFNLPIAKLIRILSYNPIWPPLVNSTNISPTGYPTYSYVDKDSNIFHVAGQKVVPTYWYYNSAQPKDPAKPTGPKGVYYEIDTRFLKLLYNKRNTVFENGAISTLLSQTDMFEYLMSLRSGQFRKSDNGNRYFSDAYSGLDVKIA